MGLFDTTEVMIYVSCLASYNAGKGYGEWLDLDEYESLDDLQDEVNSILKDSPMDNAEEYRIDDYENVPYCPGTLEQAWDMHELIQEYGEVARAALSYDESVEFASQRCENIAGVVESYDALGAQELDDNDIPSHIAYHVDTKELGKDCADRYLNIEWDGEIYLFNH